MKKGKPYQRPARTWLGLTISAILGRQFGTWYYCYINSIKNVLLENRFLFENKAKYVLKGGHYPCKYEETVFSLRLSESKECSSYCKYGNS